MRRASTLVLLAAASTLWCCGGASLQIAEKEAAMGPSIPAGLSVFDTCQRQLSLGLGVFYLCEELGFGAFISERLPWEAQTRPENLKKFASASAQSIHGPGSTPAVKTGQMRFFTDEMPAVWYTADGIDGGMDFVGQYTLAPVGEEVRVIGCFTSRAWGFEGCSDILERLYPERSFGALKARYRVSAPLFAGVPLRVPSGCRKTGSRTLTCPHSELAVAPLGGAATDLASQELREDQLAFFKEVCAEPRAWTEPCVVGGQEGACHHALCLGEDGAIQGIVAHTRSGPRPSAASCRFDPQHFTTLPEVCAQVISTAIEAPAEP